MFSLLCRMLYYMILFLITATDMGKNKGKESLDVELILKKNEAEINENVAKAKEKLKKMIYECDIYCSFFEWDLADGKGLDDFALHWLDNRTNVRSERSDE